MIGLSHGSRLLPGAAWTELRAGAALVGVIDSIAAAGTDVAGTEVAVAVDAAFCVSYSAPQILSAGPSSACLARASREGFQTRTMTIPITLSSTATSDENARYRLAAVPTIGIVVALPSAGWLAARMAR